MNILEEIVVQTKEALARRKQEVPQEGLMKRLEGARAPAGFKAALSLSGTHLVAEIKKSSPSAGVIRQDFDPPALARAYAGAGVSALSVLTEETYFGGSLSIFDEVRKAVSLPLLRKDFIVDEYQIYESRAHGADAVLLIASLLDAPTLRRFAQIARECSLDVLLEIHDDSDIEKVGEAPEAVLGINTRDLKNFSVDLAVLPRLMQKLPGSRIVVCESGIKDTGDLALIRQAGAQGVLVGTALMRAPDPGALASEFVRFLKGR